MSKKIVSMFLSSVLISSSLLGACVSRPDYGSGSQNMEMGSGEQPVCADCDLKKAIEAKKRLIASEEKIAQLDRDSIADIKKFNETLEGTIKDYDKRIATLKNSGMQAFKFVLEGALAVLEVESLIGVAKAFKCLKPTAKTALVVNGVTVKGPKIMKFGLAVKDPKKVQLFVAKVAIKGTAAAANDPDKDWKDMAVGYLPLTSAAKLPQRWDEWINADELIAAIEDSKKDVDAMIKKNGEDIAGLEELLKLTEENIKKQKELLKQLEEELAMQNGLCLAVDDTDPTTTTTTTTTTTSVITVPTTGILTQLVTLATADGQVATADSTDTSQTEEGSASTGGTTGTTTETTETTEPIDGAGSASGTMCAAYTDFVDWDDPGTGCSGTRPSVYVEGTGLPEAGPDNTTFPWGYDFYE